MLDNLQSKVKPSTSTSLARAFTRLGWTGFWLQVVMGSLAVLFMLYYFAFSPSAGSGSRGFSFMEWLTIANLVILAFTTFWSYRYTKVGQRIADPAQRPPEASVVKLVWTGVVASMIGMLYSMLVILIEAANLLFYFLKAPQAGVPVINTAGAESPHFVSAVDMVSLLILILTLFGELIVLVFSLWLLFRTSLSSPEYPQPEAS